MNKRIGRLGAIFVAAFMFLIANLTYIQFIAADNIASKIENIRPILYGMKIRRGDIISADGKVLATSRKLEDRYERHYPNGQLVANITGFFSQKYGRAGLELTYDRYLSGQAKVSSIDDYTKRLFGKEKPGNDLVLTIDMELQKVAKKALGMRKGSVVALNPKTGAILALLSQPSYDPNDIGTKWDLITHDPDGIMVNRATQGKFTPGSSFKIITAATAIESGLVSTDTAYHAPPQLKIYGGKVTNYGNKGYPRITFADAFAKSVNTVFAQIGNKLGGAKLTDMAGNFGFNNEIPFDLPVSMSSVPTASEMDDLEVAWMAVGQGRIQSTPLNMALVGAAVANDGKIMQPYLVEEAREHDAANVVFKRKPRVWSSPISGETATILKSLMENVVDKGTGKLAKADHVRVGGKTGTAEVEKKPPHAWFVGFAPVDDPQVVVAVIIENGGSGGRTAAPVARTILISALGKNR